MLKTERNMRIEPHFPQLEEANVGKSDPIQVHPPTKGRGNPTNSIIDRGANSGTPNQELLNTLAECFSKVKDCA
jgi:hypothetical protein